MRFVRCLLLMLLALNLPGVGGAFGGALGAAPACAMQHGESAGRAMAAAGEHAAHCCNDGQSRDHAADHSQNHACQDGMQCQCNALYQAAQPFSATVSPAAPDIARAAILHPLPAVVVPLWRPPTPV